MIRGKADYVLALKGNQESLHRAVIEHIDERLDGDLAGGRELTTTDHGHGREEQRTYLQLPAPADLPGRGEWKGLKSIGVATSRRVEGGRESIEVRYYLSSLPVDVELFARAVRGHWSVENYHRGLSSAAAWKGRRCGADERDATISGCRSGRSCGWSTISTPPGSVGTRRRPGSYATPCGRTSPSLCTICHERVTPMSAVQHLMTRRKSICFRTATWR